MVAFQFHKNHALKAIQQVEVNDLQWLYDNFPKPRGQKRKSSTGFLVHNGVNYPVKPLGRLASEIAGHAMVDNPKTNEFRRHFEQLGFQFIDSPESEAKEAEVRQRQIAETWARPKQAEFRRAVFSIFGNACVISNCSTLAAVEAAHIVPVAVGGTDTGSNGLPLRADLHRLFDAGILTIDPNNWQVAIAENSRDHYAEFHRLNLQPKIENVTESKAISAALRKRQQIQN